MRLVNKILRALTGVNLIQLQEENENYKTSIESLQQFCNVGVKSLEVSFPRTEKSDELGKLFTEYGSDKALAEYPNPVLDGAPVGKHSYHRFYSTLDNTKPLTILEIGLGTNNLSIPGNMGVNGMPGAGLRAFKEWGGDFQLYGADIDAGCLFTEDRIKTFHVDQLNAHSLQSLARKLPKFDMIIDDGLHRPHANFNTLHFAIPLLKKGGMVVIEDIAEKYLPLWKSVVQILGGSLYQEAQGKRKSLYILTI